MPPSRHSSSSHSSRSRSSSRRSSSHRSSSRSSSPSRHSSSSHSSSSRSSGPSYRSSARTRSNQPRGWDEKTQGQALTYRLKKHDYVYYPHSWTGDNGTLYREGYYDENGQYYANMLAENIQTNLQCTYCGNHMVYTWKEGMVPTCEKCGAVFQIDITDSKEKYKENPLIYVLVTIGAVYLAGALLIAAVAVIAFIGSAIFDRDDENSFYRSIMARTEYIGESSRDVDEDYVSRSADSGSVSTYRALPDSMYVEETGRTCYPDGDNMYDMESDCWFWWNEDLLPAQWQYWYEGISSDYGDYGWMEYDDEEKKWYIEVSDGNWQELKDYDESRLWHFENAYINKYY